MIEFEQINLDHTSLAKTNMQAIVQKIVTNYKVAGEGKSLVLLHGWGANVESFNLVFKRLAKNNQVYAIDLPGFGKTQLPSKAWSVGDYAKFVDDFLVKLKIKRASFIGHSFGGRILIKLAAQKPKLFERLILTGAAGIKSKNNFRKNVFMATAKIGKAVLSLPGLRAIKEQARKKLYYAAGTDDYLDAGELKKTFIRVTQEDLTPFLSQIKIPTLLIWGINDLDTPVSEGKIMEQEILNSKLFIIQNAGHFAFIDQPKEFLKIASDFLEE